MVVVGGGVIGTSIAFHLAEAGTDVCLLERDQLAADPRAAPQVGFRAQFSDPLNIAIGLRSIEAFTRFAERPGAEIDLHQVGYLFLLDRAEDVAAFESSVALQNELGVPSRFVDLDEIRELCPIAGLDGVLAATYCPLDGHASPEAVVAGLRGRSTEPRRDRAHRLRCDGGRARRHARSARSRHRSAQSQTVTVVCAAGAWSPGSRAPSASSFPSSRIFREVGFTSRPTASRRASRSRSTSRPGFYFHREGPGLLFGMADRDQPPGFDAPPIRRWLEKVMEVAERRLPSLLDMGIAGGWKGYYEVTPDHNALVGKAPDVAALPLRDRLLGPRLPAGPGDPARSSATSCSDASPFVDVVAARGQSASRTRQTQPRAIERDLRARRAISTRSTVRLCR